MIYYNNNEIINTNEKFLEENFKVFCERLLRDFHFWKVEIMQDQIQIRHLG